jgi:putative endonuclease
MASHNEFGKKGEELARLYLIKKGYQILKSNWRFSYKEVDIICKKNQFLIIVEVKTRSDNYFQEPWESVEHSKRKHLIEAAEAFIEGYNDFEEIRYDILSIVMRKNAEPEIEHIEDAFIPGID